MTDQEFGKKEYPIKEASLLCSCSVSENEWENLFLLSQENNRIVPFYGTHPWFANTYNGPDKLVEMLKKDPHSGIGEIGLDKLHGNLDDQLQVFFEQLDIAETMRRPANIHMIKTEEMILASLRKRDLTAILHSFKGPISYVKPFTEAGCYFSISPRSIRASESKNLELLRSIPMDRLLIETDAPNNDMNMDDTIASISKILDIDLMELTSVTTDNLKRILP